MDIGLSRIHFPVTTLGPGYRLGIWLQGCHLRCAGCISMDTWPPAKKPVSIDSVLESIIDWITLAEGITISGGEPFEQPQALAYLVSRLKQQTDVDILVYTGLAIENISDEIALMAGNIDVIISDPFEQQTSQTKVLRGSDNQRMHLLTELGKARFSSLQNQFSSEQDKVLDIMFDQDGTIWLAGIPKREDFLLLKQLLESEGHQLTTTAQHSTIKKCD